MKELQVTHVIFQDLHNYESSYQKFPVCAYTSLFLYSAVVIQSFESPVLEALLLTRKKMVIKSIQIVMATLIYSDKCINCYEVIEFIKTEESLHSVVSYHHIRDGVPADVNNVPSLITENGELYVGKKNIENFLKKIIPKPKLSSMKSGYFKISDFGKIKTPVMTEEFKKRTEMSISDAIAELKD